MSALLDNDQMKFIRIVFLFQPVTFLTSGFLFNLKEFTWATSALAGGITAWLPNMLFMCLAWRLQTQMFIKKYFVWNFVLYETIKLIITFIFLGIMLGVFKAVFWPLVITWLSVIVVQIIAFSRN
ncbi:ATP synthase subunit I [Candidatus Pantoea carbekii]|uniref:Uncharacterized protein n=1 Tax=Candidatus Pantoea carbekii TaxID=1235990 RepID=U3U8R4_9GAMM|nr:ATP synthase subunit I [Candidatus Pantoea carbekii]AKC32304.1 ATP synthase protein I AtpI [Candidatus Pantoea carbekii]BAO00018.1 hypothetical protein HHS_00480 [Candidatus Pantoea carbekii]